MLVWVICKVRLGIPHVLSAFPSALPAAAPPAVPSGHRRNLPEGREPQRRSSLAVRWPHTAAVRPVLALQPKAASAWLRAGPLVELTPALKGAAKVRAVLASHP